MAFTTRGWSRYSSGQITFAGWPEDLFTPIGNTNPPFPPGGPWTLLRTIIELTVTIFAPPESGHTGTFPEGTSAWLGAKFGRGIDTPNLVRNDLSPDVLGIHQLVPTISGDPGNIASKSVTWIPATPFDNRTARRTAPDVEGVVAAYLWLDVGDLGAASGSYSVRNSTLWGQ